MCILLSVGDSAIHRVDEPSGTAEINVGKREREGSENHDREGDNDDRKQAASENEISPPNDPKFACKWQYSTDFPPLS